jgi:hypothetical protein
MLELTVSDGEVTSVLLNQFPQYQPASIAIKFMVPNLQWGRNELAL